MKKEYDPLRLSPGGAIGSIVIGSLMLVLTFFMTKAMVKLIRENDHFSIKQIIISLIVFLVFFGSGSLFLRRGLKRFAEMFERVDKE